MGARKQKPKARTIDMHARPVPSNWAELNELLEAPHIMSIAKCGYAQVLDLVRTGVLRPVPGFTKPLKFAPRHVHQVFFEAQSAQESRPRVSALRSLKTEGNSKASSQKPPKREVLWRK